VKFIFYLLFLPLWLLQKMIPRKKNWWIIGSWYGQKFSDNSKSFYLYLKSNHSEIRPIWLTRNKKVYHELKSNGHECYLAYSWQGIIKSLLAKIVIVSSGKADINPFFINGAIWIQLWHGAPMKRISLDDEFANHQKLSERIKRLLFPFAYEFNFHYVVSTASIFNNKMSSAFNVTLSHVLLTGYPRNDIFYSDETHPLIKKWNQDFNSPAVVIYLPTFRSPQESIDIFGDFGFDEEKVHTLLESENMILVTKGHFVDDTLSLTSSHPRIIHLSDSAVEEINPLLKDANILITDYSGAYFDFLLTERPVIFAPFDIDTYLSKHRKLYFEYNKIIVGPIARNWDEVCENLRVILKQDVYKEQRTEMNKFFNQFHDGKSSRRLYDEIINILTTN